MSKEEIKAKFRRFNEEVYNKGNMDAWDELFVPEYVEHTFPFGDIGPLKVVKERLAGLKSGVSDYHAMIDELIVEGETVTMRFHSEGIHTGELFGVLSTDKKIVINGCCVYHMKNGKVIEAFIYNDWLGLLQQLGVVPQLR
jgi:predicted ester cyclase